VLGWVDGLAGDIHPFIMWNIKIRFSANFLIIEDRKITTKAEDSEEMDIKVLFS
jgi:hypothetical protein